MIIKNVFLKILLVLGFLSFSHTSNFAISNAFAADPVMPACHQLIDNPGFNTSSIGNDRWFYWNGQNTESTRGVAIGNVARITSSGNGNGCWSQNITPLNFQGKTVSFIASLKKSIVATHNPYISINISRDWGYTWENNYGGISTIFGVGEFEQTGIITVDIPNDVTSVRVNYCVWGAPVMEVYADWMSLCDVLQSPSISGTKYKDISGDGWRDDPLDRSSLGGWEIKLLNNTTNETTKTTTATDGTYAFSNLPTGSYTVSETAQTGWLQTHPTGDVHTFNLAVGENKTAQDFYNHQQFAPTCNASGTFTTVPSPAAINTGSSVTFNFSNIATDADADDIPLTYILNFGDGQSNLNATTGVSHTYTTAGTYTATIKAKDKHGAETASTCKTATVTVTTPPALGSISGTKYKDISGDGINVDPTSDREPLGGWEIVIRNTVTGDSMAVTTATNGTYSFSNRVAGSYTVSETAQSGWTQTHPIGGVHTFNLAVGENKTAQDFYNHPLGSISGKKIIDLNANGQLDAGENWKSGWTINCQTRPTPTLPWVDCPARQSVTDAGTGLYGFYNLPAGEYKITEDTLSDWTVVSPPLTDGYTITLTAGQNLENKNFYNHQQFAPTCNASGTFTTVPSPATINPNGVVTFNFSNIATDADADDIPLTYILAFGDGQSNLNATTGVSHTYTTAGTYTATIKAKDKHGAETAPTCKTATVTVTSPTYSIGDFVWEDMNGNGIQDTDEMDNGINGVRVDLYPATDTTCAGNSLKFSTTNSTGHYEIPDVSPGVYRVTTVVPLAVVGDPYGRNYTHLPSLPGSDTSRDSNARCSEITVATVNDTTIDFGFVKVGIINLQKKGSNTGDNLLAGAVFYIETSRSAICESRGNCPPYVGQVYDPSNSNRCFKKVTGIVNDHIQSSLTLCPRTYTITEVSPPPGYNLPPENQRSQTVSLQSGEVATLTFIDTPVAPTSGSISGKKINDLNGNGVLDAGETGLAGWAISCQTRATPTSPWVNCTAREQITAPPTGIYIFSNLPAGEYKLTEGSVPNWIATNPPLADGYTITLTAGQNLENKNFYNHQQFAPTCNASGTFTTVPSPATINPNGVVTFNFSNIATDADADDIPLTYILAFGDGQSNLNATTGVSHTYTTAGTYTATIKAKDKHGAETATVCGSIAVTVSDNSLLGFATVDYGNINGGDTTYRDPVTFSVKTLGLEDGTNTDVKDVIVIFSPLGVSQQGATYTFSYQVEYPTQNLPTGSCSTSNNINCVQIKFYKYACTGETRESVLNCPNPTPEYLLMHPGETRTSSVSITVPANLQWCGFMQMDVANAYYTVYAQNGTPTIVPIPWQGAYAVGLPQTYNFTTSEWETVDECLPKHYECNGTTGACEPVLNTPNNDKNKCDPATPNVCQYLTCDSAINACKLNYASGTPQQNTGDCTNQNDPCGLGSISGKKINDFNANGQLDTGEVGLDGWNIQLSKRDSSGNWTSLGYKTTDPLNGNGEKGSFIWRNLDQGVYKLNEAVGNYGLPAGWVVVNPPLETGYEITLTAGQNMENKNFYNRQIASASCSSVTVNPTSGQIKGNKGYYQLITTYTMDASKTLDKVTFTITKQGEPSQSLVCISTTGNCIVDTVTKTVTYNNFLISNKGSYKFEATVTEE